VRFSHGQDEYEACFGLDKEGCVLTPLLLSRSARVTLVAAIAWAMPTLAFAQGKSQENVPGHECENGLHVGNPHCQVPEVPATVLYPVLGLITFGALEFARRRRNAPGEH